MNKNILKRKTLIDIIENQSGKHNYYVIEMYAVLQLLKKEIEKYEYYEDKRFMPELINGEYKERQFFLKEEAERRIEADDVLFAFKNLVELISANNPCLYYPNLPRGTYKDASDKDRHEDYYKDGFICEKEKNIIMEMITSIEKYCCEKYEIKNGNIEINYLKIGETKFNLKENTSNLRIKYDSEDLISINVDVSFEDGVYNELNASPHIEINNIKTSGNKIADLKGVKFEINDINESYDRGDSFYLYESEPFLQYKLEILENNWETAHIKLQGICITDGYSKPYKTENFTVDAIVRIEIYNSEKTIGAKKTITNSNNDEKYVNFFMFVLLGIISGYCLFRSIYQFLPLLFTIFLLLSTVFCWYKAFKIYRSIALNKNFVKRKKTHNKNNNATAEKENNNVIKMENQKNLILKSVKEMLTEDTYNKLKKMYIGELDVVFFEKGNIDVGQYGFRYNDLRDEIINEWPGNEYVIIGYDSTTGCGPDPYIMKTDEKELPIYWLMTDGGDWKNPNKIANSFNDFIKIIECINKNLNSENELNKELILSEIAKINSNENMEYWKSLLGNIVRNEENDEISKIKFHEVIDEYKKLTEKECYSINLMEEEPGILDNKIGGKPYLPIGEEYPIDKFGNPMELLLQINLNDIQLEGWPKEGILEIFISLEEDDYEYNCTIKLFKENLEYQTTFPKLKTSYPTLKQGYKIILTKNICHMPITDNRFNVTIWSIIERIYNIKKNASTPLYKIFGSTKWNEELSSSINNHLVTIGGYSEFVDAPLYDEDDNKIEILFKLDPNINPSNFDIIEQRILNVIIYKDDILSLNFNNVKINY